MLTDLVRDPVRAQREFSALPRNDRLVLLESLLHACFPGDVVSMQNILAKYANSAIDMISRLPVHLALRVLLTLPLPDFLRCKLVCKAWHRLITDHEIDVWKHYVALITRYDPIPACPPLSHDSSSWKQLYKSLHFRESNWNLGLAQRISVFRGHTSFVTCLKQYGHILITGSYDETIRIWNIDKASLERTIRVQGSSISCLDCSVPKNNLICAGCHDVGRVLLIDMRTGNIIHKLSGHNKGIKAITMNDHYVISAGMDKALVVWDWKTASKVVRFGQQTVPPIGISFIDTHRFVSVQTDGIIRTFDISQRKLVGQFTPRDLLKGYAPMKNWLSSLTSNSTNVFMWLFAHDQFLSLGTRDFLLYFQWPCIAHAAVDISKPPRLISYIRTNASTNDLVTGVSDPAKRRVITATRFASRTGAPSRRIYIGHFNREIEEGSLDKFTAHEHQSETEEPFELIPIGGAWMGRVRSSTSEKVPFNGSPSYRSNLAPTTPSRTPKSSRSRLSTLASSSPSSPSTPPGSAKINDKPRPRYSTPSPVPPSAPVHETPPSSSRSASGRRSSSSSLSLSSTSTPTIGSRYTPPPASRSPGSVSIHSSASTMDDNNNAMNDLDLASPNMNPMAMVCDHEKLVVGTTGGIVYSVSFVGSRFRETVDVNDVGEFREQLTPSKTHSSSSASH